MQILINNKEVNKTLKDKILQSYPLEVLLKKKLWAITSLPFGKGEIIDIVDNYSKAQRRTYTRFKKKRKGYYTRIKIKNLPSNSLLQTIINELQ
jgi:hypothetical protein